MKQKDSGLLVVSKKIEKLRAEMIRESTLFCHIALQYNNSEGALKVKTYMPSNRGGWGTKKSFY